MDKACLWEPALVEAVGQTQEQISDEEHILFFGFDVYDSAVLAWEHRRLTVIAECLDDEGM